MTHQLTIDLNPCITVFLQTIAAAQARQETIPALEAVYRTTQGRLDQQWATLERLAEAGLDDQVPPTFAILLREWAVYEAVEVLLRYGYAGRFLDPQDRGLAPGFREKLTRQQQALASELLLLRECGARERQRQQEQQAQVWEASASRVVVDQQAALKQSHEMTLRLIQEQQQTMQHGHQVAQRWSEVALQGVLQDQRGAGQLLTFAENVQKNVLGMLDASEEHYDVLVEEATRRQTVRRRTRLYVVIGMTLFFFALFGCAFIALTHLY